jgi:quinol monooxygenase YgiN
MDGNVAWMLELRVQKNFGPLMAEMVAATKANEPGTLAYEWSTNPDGTVCHLYERYADSAAAMIHIGTFGEKFAARFLDALQPIRLVVYGTPNAEVRAALAGFGAVHMEPAGGFSR